MTDDATILVTIGGEQIFRVSKMQRLAPVLFLFLALLGNIKGTNAIPCPTVEVKSLKAIIDVSDIPELANNKLRICMRDDPNRPQIMSYLQQYALMPYAMMNADAVRSATADVARALASTMVGRNGKVIDADIFIFNDFVVDILDPLTEENKSVIGCLQAVKDGMCDLGMCGSFMTAERASTYGVSWIPELVTQLEKIVVYPRSAACTTVQTSDLCGSRVYTKQGSAQHGELIKMNLGGGVCATSPMDIHASSLHFEDFQADCHDADDTHRCFLIGAAASYFYDVCQQSPPVEGPDYTNCDLTRLVGNMYGVGWAVRSTDHKLHRAVSMGFESLIRAKYTTNELYEYGYLDSKWNLIQGYPCLTKNEDMQMCATLSTCSVPTGQDRCVTSCLNPNNCVPV